MSTFDTAGIGRVHLELAHTARRLDEDGHGHSAIAIEYQERADTERHIYDSVSALGGESKRLAYVHRDRPDEHGGPTEAGNPALHGADLADWLVRHGWTPPAHFNGRITE